MDKKEFEAIYQQYYQKIYYFVKKRVTQKEMAEDLTSEIFEKAYTALGRYDDTKCSMQTWLFVITNNHLKNFYRDKKEYIEFDDKVESSGFVDAGIDEIIELKEKQSILKEALKTLPKREQNIIMYRYFMDMTAAQIAVKMDLSAGNVRIITKRALEKLRHILVSSEELRLPKRVCKHCGSPVQSFAAGSGYYRCTSPECPFRRKYGDTRPMEECDVVIK